MQAIILAAGMGKRLKNLTKNNTKCMVKVNGVPLIDRVLRQLDKKNVSRIVIAVGYMKEKLIKHISSLDISTPVEYVENNIFDKTNNIYSLWLCKEQLCTEDTLLLESDLIFEDSVLDAIIDDPHENLALVDKYESWMDGTCVKLSDDDRITAFVPGKNFRYDEINSYYKTVNIYKFSAAFSNNFYVPFLEAYCTVLGRNEYYEQVLRVIAMVDNSEILAKRLNGQLWYEIDDIQDLDIAESMFISDENQRVALLQGRYGGYWRYPHLIDFCYLVNPYFPPQKLIDEIKASFEILLTQYPSGMRVNSLLAAKNFGVPEQNIIVGNGAAELIKSLMESFKGKLGIIRPTFEEYANRYDQKDIVAYSPENDQYTYNTEDLIKFFSDKNIANLVVINPDNPSGNYIKKSDLLKLVEWTKEKGIKIVIDESFADFADEQDNTLIKTEILEDNPHLYVVKSISKSYGVPGLRLGVLASGDTDVISAMKKDVSIWNINSFGEFYLQIEEKYNKDYTAALKRFRKERIRFQAELSLIKGLRVIPSQANYIMAEITNGMTAAELTRVLIINHNILIKNLSPKMDLTGRQYVRLAVKTVEENNKLISALKKVLM